MLKLYDTLRSGNAWKVRLLASYLQIPMLRITLSIDRGDLETASFQEVAPFQQVPVLTLPDGTHLAESMAILQYLAQGSRWWPDDRVVQARTLSWLSFEQHRHMRPLSLLRLHLALRRDRNTDSDEFKAHAEEAHRSLGFMEDQLQRQSDTAWIATSDLPSIADVALYPYTCMAPMGGIELDRYPRIRNWLDKMERLPGYQSLFPGHPERNHSPDEQP